ncbi:MAG: hypothetical protein AAGB10_06960 [Pseudomonadota bacterium]
MLTIFASAMHVATRTEQFPLPRRHMEPDRQARPMMSGRSYWGSKNTEGR